MGVVGLSVAHSPRTNPIYTGYPAIQNIGAWRRRRPENGCPDTGAGFSLAPRSAFRRGLASVLTPNWEKKTSVSSARNCSGLIIGWAFSTKTSETTEAADAVVRSDAAAVMVINSPNQSENERKVESPRMAICRC